MIATSVLALGCAGLWAVWELGRVSAELERLRSDRAHDANRILSALGRVEAVRDAQGRDHRTMAARLGSLEDRIEDLESAAEAKGGSDV